MNIIVDTHIYLWVLSEPERVPNDQLHQLSSLANTVYVSAVSISEIIIKASVGRLTLNFDPLEMIEKCGFTRLDYSCEDAALLNNLPLHHKDPFVRMLVAQSLNRNYPLATVDEKFKMYDCKLV